MDDFIEEEEEDLYSDLPNFKYDETVDKVCEKVLHFPLYHLFIYKKKI